MRHEQERPKIETAIARNESWQFDRKVSFPQTITAVMSVVGLVFLVLQWNQTDAALQESKTANRLTDTAQKAAAKDAAEQEKRAVRQLELAAEMSSSASLSARTANDALAETRRQFVVI